MSYSILLTVVIFSVVAVYSAPLDRRATSCNNKGSTVSQVLLGLNVGNFVLVSSPDFNELHYECIFLVL